MRHRALGGLLGSRWRWWRGPRIVVHILSESPLEMNEQLIGEWRDFWFSSPFRG